MRLFILRHADAESDDGKNDAGRKLTPEGIAQAQDAANAIRILRLNLTAVLTSPTARAAATAEIAAARFPSLRVQALDYLLPAGDPKDLFRDLQSFSRDSRVLLVTHKPFATRCIASLVGMNNDAKISIRKASLSCVEIGSPVQRGGGVLLWLLTNEQLRLMKE